MSSGEDGLESNLLAKCLPLSQYINCLILHRASVLA